MTDYAHILVPSISFRLQIKNHWRPATTDVTDSVTRGADQTTRLIVSRIATPSHAHHPIIPNLRPRLQTDGFSHRYDGREAADAAVMSNAATSAAHEWTEAPAGSHRSGGSIFRDSGHVVDWKMSGCRWGAECFCMRGKRDNGR